MIVEHFIGLNRTLALPLAVEGWMELIQSNHCSNVILVHGDQDAFVVFDEGLAVGVITYRHDVLHKEFAIGVGYIKPSGRGKGLYKILWQALVDYARSLNVVTISSATYIENHKMRAVAIAQGRIEKTVTLDYAL